MARADVIVTDSGGVQEEAPSLGKPVVILREETERGEGVAAGGSFLVGTDPDAVVATVLRLLEPNPNRPAQARDLVGDGWAAERIARALLPSFQLDPGPEPLGFTPDWNPDGSS
jgi:UDP-N-acetylglucosamine 2-epimerase (non-hydrolysing)